MLQRPELGCTRVRNTCLEANRGSCRALGGDRSCEYPGPRNHCRVYVRAEGQSIVPGGVGLLLLHTHGEPSDLIPIPLTGGASSPSLDASPFPNGNLHSEQESGAGGQIAESACPSPPPPLPTNKHTTQYEITKHMIANKTSQGPITLPLGKN